ncbi:hypothetical protein EHM69_12080 [candidate division KSB1 bacterium]|nr:MAG: hypothetical protein EHM69_12080 [candidate division KSB1 bacterium]
MSELAAAELLDVLMKNLKEILSTKTIVGEPVQVGKTTILPVMKVALGFGAGGGTPPTSEKGFHGGGGGGGVAITPVGFLIVEEGRAMMVTPKSSKWDWVVESIPDMFEKLVKIRKEYQSTKDSPAGESSGENKAAES